MRTNPAYDDPYDRDDPKRDGYAEDLFDRADDARGEL